MAITGFSVVKAPAGWGELYYYAAPEMIYYPTDNLQYKH